ncbi:hypothetical protein [Lentzea aerocolonigenes]|uniref:hypothetical protein n=1 Tax=Lentzea aerocolonigenes TaxID=68170 RepID=UPI0004C3F033|nr:hypothetical protein [Lentzea aerocolonigenes]MCP2250513.1 hypothetical protein [Lentzea aerocolonigenes]
MTTSYSDPRPVVASLKQPEIDRASLNDVLQDQGWGVQAVNWVFEAVTGESLVATIITPITGDWTKIRADGDAWRMVGNAMNDVSYNLTDAVGKVRGHWDGDAARAHEKYIALGWKAGLLAEMGVAQLIAKGFDTVASGAEALGKQAARLLDYLVNKLLEAAATVWIPLAGWIKAAEMVWNAYQIYRRVMDIIDTVQKLISDVKALFDAVGRVFSAIGKLKDADTLAEAMNATQEVAEAGRDVRNAVNDIHDDMTSIKDSATEIADRGHDIGSKVREVYTPPGSPDDGTKAAAVTSVAPGGAPVSAPPTLHGSDAPATHAAAVGGPAVSAPPSVGSGGGGGGGGGVPTGGVPTGGHAPAGVPTGHAGSGGAPAGTPPRLDTTHAAGAAPTAAPPTHSQTPMGGAMPMGAPMAPGGGGDQTRSSGSRPGGSGVPAFPSAGTPSGQAKPPTGLPTPPGHGASGLPTAPGQTPASGGARPGGLPTSPSGTGSHGSGAGTHPTPGSAGSHPTPGVGGTHPGGAHSTPGSAGTHPTPGSAGSHPTPGSGGTHPGGAGGGLPTPPNSGAHPSGPGAHPTPGGSGSLPTPPEHPSASSGTATAPAPSTGGGLPSPPGHPSPSTGGGLPSPPGHPSPSAGGGLPSPPGHPSPSSGGGLPGHPSPDHSTPSGSGGTTPHDPSGPRPHDTTPHDSGTKPHDADGQPHDATKPHDAADKPHTDGQSHDAKPHDTDTKPHDGDAKPHDTDTKPHDGDTKPHDGADTDKPHDTDTSGADDVKPHDPQPDHDAPPAHDTDPKLQTDDASPGHTGDGDGGNSNPAPSGPDLKGHFDAAAMAAQGQGYQHQLEQILPNQADRDRYVELSQKLSTDLSAAEAQHVADVRNQIKVGTGDIVTKALNQQALSTYLPDTPHAAGSKQETWQGQLGGSVARGQDVVDINTPAGLRDGLALDDKGKGWTPIPDGAPSAMQLRYEVTDQNADAHNVPFGGPKKDVADYASPQEQAHYEASQKQMAAAGGSSKVYDGYDPFTGTGYTMGGVPEWRVDGGTPLPDRAEIWQVNADGTEKLHAVYDRKFGGWTKIP